MQSTVPTHCRSESALFKRWEIPQRHRWTSQSRNRWRLHLVLVGAMLYTAIPTVTAQSVKGVVKDAGSGMPVADASVVLLDDKGKIQRGTLSELDGSYTITAPKSGRYSIRVGAAGYNTTDAPEFELSDGQVSEIDIMLASTTESGPPGFEARKNRGEGEFLTRAEIETMGSGQLTEVLRYVPGVTIVRLPVAEREASAEEVKRGGRSSYQTVRVKPDRETAGARHVAEEAPDCVPVLWVDGQWWGPLDEASDGGLDGKFLPIDIEAIEIYSHPSILPDQFNSGKDAQDCGVVVLWLIKKD